MWRGQEGAQWLYRCLRKTEKAHPASPRGKGGRNGVHTSSRGDAGMHTFQGITEEGAGAPRRRPQGSRGRELRWVSGPDAEWQRYLQTATCQGLEQEVPSSGDIRARNGGETIPPPP